VGNQCHRPGHQWNCPAPHPYTLDSRSRRKRDHTWSIFRWKLLSFYFGRGRAWTSSFNTNRNSSHKLHFCSSSYTSGKHNGMANRGRWRTVPNVTCFLTFRLQQTVQSTKCFVDHIAFFFTNAKNAARHHAQTTRTGALQKS